MTLLVDTNAFASRLCSDFVRRVAQRGQFTFIVTQFKYPDGDFVSLYLDQSGDSIRVSDRGDTMFKCRIKGVEITDARRKWIETICGIYDLRFEDSVFYKRVTMERAGVDCLLFCEAIAKISSLEYDVEARQRSLLPAQVESIIHMRVEPVRSVSRNWTDEKVDPKRSFTVDYRFNGTGAPRQMFHVASREKSTLIAAVSSFQRLQGIFVPTMSVVAQDLELGTHQLDRLQRASTEIKFGTTGNEDRIVDFALGH
jgi:hypothetical protein